MRMRVTLGCGFLVVMLLSGLTDGTLRSGQRGVAAAATKDDGAPVAAQETLGTRPWPQLPAAPLGMVSGAATPILPSPSRVLEVDFASKTLGRSVRYDIYLPAGYDSDPARRYPVLYYLHGIGGDPREWLGYGLRETADQLMGSGAIRPFLIVLPEGDQGYWVDQVNGGPQWATYVANDVVAAIDGTYRTIADRQDRAIGGLSMGAHGALQIALNHPDVFSIVGAHSPSFRPRQDLPAYFGDDSDVALRDPFALLAAHPDIARTLTIWLDFGDHDPYRDKQSQFEQQLTDEGIPHQFHLWQGNHDGAYWSGHLNDYLRFYAASFPAAR